MELTQLETTQFPIGTLREVTESHLDPKLVATCGPSITGVQAGCPFYSDKKKLCMFRAGSPFVPKEAQFRDKQNEYGERGVGPENVGFFRKLGSNGAEQGFVMPCYLVMHTVYEWMLQKAKTGDKFSRFYLPGEKVRQRVRRALHPEVDPTCPKCKKGECNRSVMVEVELPVTPFPRPNDSIEGGLYPWEDESPVADVIEMERTGPLQRPQMGSDTGAALSSQKARGQRLSESLKSGNAP